MKQRRWRREVLLLWALAGKQRVWNIIKKRGWIRYEVKL